MALPSTRDRAQRRALLAARLERSTIAIESPKDDVCLTREGACMRGTAGFGGLGDQLGVTVGGRADLVGQLGEPPLVFLARRTALGRWDRCVDVLGGHARKSAA